MFSTEVRVRYADTDAMGVAYHANYLIWFEVGRVELLRSWGMPYTLFEQQGIFVPVVEAGVRWLYPAKYDDILRIEPRVVELSPARVKFAYRMVRVANEQPVCEGWTRHAFVNFSGRPVALPRQARALYDGFKAKLGQMEGSGH